MLIPEMKTPRFDIHLGVFTIVFINGIISQSSVSEISDILVSVLNSNLFFLFAFYVLFDLLIEGRDDVSANSLDYLICGVVILTLLLFGRIGVSRDVGLTTAALAVLFWWRRETGSARYIAVVWFALTLNLLIAPLLFQIFKSYILIAEVDFVALMWRCLGFNVWSDGQLLVLEHGMKIRLIGACSVFTNLSFGFLCYASVKAFNRRRMSYSDVIIVASLIFLLILGNTIRIGLMLPSRADYEFWHHGSGATIFGLAQFFIIVAASYLSIRVRSSKC